MSINSKEVLLEIKNMQKSFGPTKALRGVDLKVFRGEIRGLVGENGSGKSTITSIASGMQKPSSGSMLFKGEEWKPGSMIEAQAKGVSMILQEANTIPGVTVAQNLFAGQEGRFAKAGFINYGKMFEEADLLLERMGVRHIRGKDKIDR